MAGRLALSSDFADFYDGAFAKHGVIELRRHRSSARSIVERLDVATAHGLQTIPSGPVGMIQNRPHLVRLRGGQPDLAEVIKTPAGPRLAGWADAGQIGTVFVRPPAHRRANTAVSFERFKVGDRYFFVRHEADHEWNAQAEGTVCTFLDDAAPHCAIDAVGVMVGRPLESVSFTMYQGVYPLVFDYHTAPKLGALEGHVSPRELVELLEAFFGLSS